MFKNLVFDFGNVVVRFDPDYMVSTVTDIAEEKEILKRTVFNPITFELTDRGYVTLEKHIATVLPEVPTALHEKAVKLLREWYLNLPVVSGMEELLLDAKKSGYKLFLLSNINSHFGTHRNEVQILSLFDGLVLSSDIHFCWFFAPKLCMVIIQGDFHTQDRRRRGKAPRLPQLCPTIQPE
jgi:putative hydrolase of the HAD superfamily